VVDRAKAVAMLSVATKVRSRARTTFLLIIEGTQKTLPAMPAPLASLVLCRNPTQPKTRNLPAWMVGEYLNGCNKKKH